MTHPSRLRVVLIKPSKYEPDGWVQRFRLGFMPNATLWHMRSLTPDRIGDVPVEVHAIDEYVQPNADYLKLLHAEPGTRVLLGLVGVQSHQFQRALDLAAYARVEGKALAVIGGPHVMTCETSELRGRGVSLALSEGELIWPRILSDALHEGELLPIYGGEQRWQDTLEDVPLVPPARSDLRRYVTRMIGVYPARGCPYRCVFCSIVKIAGHQVRSQKTETTLATLRAAKQAGAKIVVFTSDNFNKFSGAFELLQGMIDERIELPFFVQCDAQVAHQPELIAMLGRAGCFQVFVGAESFDRKTLLAAQKGHNHPEQYAEIVRLCRENGVSTQFSNIVGFPQHTRQAVLDHFEQLKALGPDNAAFYVLTPLPGTEQCDQFIAEGLITETNLDRYDMTNCVWRHPELPAAELHDLMFEGYRSFYSLPRQVKKWTKISRNAQPFVKWTYLQTMIGAGVFERASATRGDHPMSGGVGRRKADHASAYAALRRAVFDIERVPLPRGLALSEHDEALNRAAKLTVPVRPAPRTVPGFA